MADKILPQRVSRFHFLFPSQSVQDLSVIRGVLENTFTFCLKI